MSKKNKPDSRGYVYSTDPNFGFESEENNIETLQPQQQKLRLKLDTRQRAGKAVTVIEGYVGTPDSIETLGRQLRNHCGTGGSVKDGHIIVQGDQRDKVFQWLIRNGYSLTKRI
jgi:translation initiation factor 1